MKNKAARIMLFGALWGTAGAWALPVDVSGSAGYSFRSLSTDHTDAISNQLLGILNLRSYIWEPWLATVEAGATLALDKSDVDQGGTEAKTESTVTSGEVNLNVLPQSRTPFQFVYQRTDSRVDDVSVDNPLVTLSGEDFKSSQLEVRQAYVTEEGHRAQARYGTRTWDSDVSGTYDDEVVGVELDWKPSRQRLLARGNLQTTDHSKTDRHAENLILDADHYYYLTDELRVDTKASYYDLDSSFEGASGIVDTTVTEISQLSSFAFWRPQDSRWIVSGGARVYSLDGSNSVQASNQKTLSATLGAYYQFSKRMRFDYSGMYTAAEINSGEEYYSRNHLGALYQSDLVDIAGFTYQWFGSMYADDKTDPDRHFQEFGLSLGHDAQKLWFTDDNTSWRLSLSQALVQNYLTEGTDPAHRLDHSVSGGWNQGSISGTTLLQVTLSDSRNLGESKDEQQLANFQISRTQFISRLSSLSGNLTLQTVRQDFNGGSNDGTVTSATGQIDYQHSRLFNVPRLQFRSDLRVSQASTDEGLDRNEWENRVDYAIGLVNTSLSLRLMDNGKDTSSLLYFRVLRRF